MDENPPVIRRIVVSCLALVASMALAPAALGQSPPWALSPPLPLPVDGGGDGFEGPAAIASDGRGGALLAWSYPGERRSRGLALAHVSPTGGIDALQRVPARPGESLEEPALEVDRHGRFTLAYLRRTPRRGASWSRVRPPPD
jgi:hypothetical protein